MGWGDGKLRLTDCLGEFFRYFVFLFYSSSFTSGLCHDIYNEYDWYGTGKCFMGCPAKKVMKWCILLFLVIFFLSILVSLFDHSPFKSVHDHYGTSASFSLPLDASYRDPGYT